MKKPNQEKECAIVMYHYVRNFKESEYPGIKGLEVGSFASQLDYLLKNYEIISLENYVEFLSGGKDIPDKSCVLTFDDGFIDHYTNVFPILKKKKTTACFFPITQPLKEFVVPSVHQTHFLLAKLGSNNFCLEFNELLKEKFPDIADKFIADDKFLKQKKSFWDKEDILAGNLKYNISIMPINPREEILNKIFNRHFKNKKDFCRKLYMDFGQIREMAEAGMSFGSHTHKHLKLTGLSVNEQREEIVKSKKILEKETGRKVKYFSYPYGDYNDKTIEILKKEKFSCALTTNFDVNKGRPENAFLLKRLDTNHVPLTI